MRKIASTLPCACLLFACLALLFACAPAQEQQASSAADEDAAEISARLRGVVEDGEKLSEDEMAALSSANAGYTADPKVVYQYPELESGCEIAALASALQSLGFRVSETDIADKYLIVDGDYENGYLASPHTDYGGGFPPGVVDAANAYLKAKKSELRARDLTGSSFGGLSALVDAGYPVLVWTTLDQTPPNYDAELGAIDDWYVNEHCVTVYEVKDGTVKAADPLQGMVELDAATFANIYTQCGSHALVIR